MAYPAKISPEEAEAICKLYIHEGLNICQLAREYAVTEAAIRKRLLAQGVRLKTQSEAQTKRRLDACFFDNIDSERKAYWLGFLLADGCVRDEPGKQPTIFVDLAQEDAGHLQALLVDLRCDTHVGFYRDKSAYISIRSARLAEGLARHGCIPRKTRVVKFPGTVPRELYPHFVRGYFDGDGSVYYSRSLQNWYMNIAGTSAFVERVRDILVEACGAYPVRPQRTGAFTYQIQFGGRRQVLRILRWLYCGATLYLPRKEQLFRQLEREVSN